MLKKLTQKKKKFYFYLILVVVTTAFALVIALIPWETIHQKQCLELAQKGYYPITNFPLDRNDKQAAIWSGTSECMSDRLIPNWYFRHIRP